MQLRYNYRLYPSPGQRRALARAFGCARVVFNDGLRARQDAFAAGLPYLTDAELSARLTASKQTPERAWLGEVSAVVLQQSLADLSTAYRNFFHSLSGKRKGPKIEPPKFKSRKDRRQAVIRDSQAMYAEDLNVAGLGRGRLAKSVHDAGWAAFVTMLEYKARRYGRVFARVARSYPSSQLCSACGRRDGPKPLHIRSWTCPACGTVHDRDVNAAVNVLAEGRRITVAAGRKPRAGMPGEAETLNACGDGVRPPLAVAAVRETGSHPKPRQDAA